MSTPRLILLPGTGADARLFAEQRRALPEIETPNWIEPLADESLAAYAARFSEQLDPRPGRPLYVGGVSFGGIVAHEIARRIRPAGLILIACFRRGVRVPMRLQLGEKLSRAIPDAALRRVAGRAFLQLVARLERLSPEQKALLAQMLGDASEAWLRWAARAAIEWIDSATPELDGVPIHQIHGRRDRIVPPELSGASQFIEGGGHMINLTHADEVNAFLRDCLRR